MHCVCRYNYYTDSIRSYSNGSALRSSNGNYNKTEEVGACSDLVCAVRYALLRIWRGGVTKRATTAGNRHVLRHHRLRLGLPGSASCLATGTVVRRAVHHQLGQWTVVAARTISLPSLHSRCLNDIYMGTRGAVLSGWKVAVTSAIPDFTSALGRSMYHGAICLDLSQEKKIFKISCCQSNQDDGTVGQHTGECEKS